MGKLIEAFSQELVSRITGLSKRQLEYWDETDVIKPSIASHYGFGTPRLYSFADLIRLKVASEMRRLGVRPSDMKVTMAAFEQRGYSDPFVSVRFYSTGGGNKVVHVDSSSEAALSAFRDEIDQQAETFGLPLRDLRTGLEATIAQILARPIGKIAKVRNVQGSVPVIQGTRVPVAKIAGLVDAGWNVERILAAYPHLTSKDVAAALRHEQDRVRAKTA